MNEILNNNEENNEEKESKRESNVSEPTQHNSCVRTVVKQKYSSSF